MRIIITRYPFFRADFIPTPNEDEKAAYVGLVFEATAFVAEENIESHIVFPGGAYQITVDTFLEEIMKLSDAMKRAIIPRWLPYLHRSEKERASGRCVTIPIAADCCEEIKTIN